MRNIQLAAVELNRNELVNLVGEYASHYVALESHANFIGDVDLAKVYGERADHFIYVADMLYSSVDYYCAFMDIAEAYAEAYYKALPADAFTYQQPLFIAA